MTDLVTVETFLVLVLARRLGLNLVLAILAFHLPLTVLALTVSALAGPCLFLLPLSTETSIGTMPFSVLVLATVEDFSCHLIERIGSACMESQVVPDRSILDASLEHSLPHIVSHGLTALLVLSDQVPELFEHIDELTELPEVTQDNLPDNADVPRGSLRLVVFRERLPRIGPFALWHILQSPLRLSARAQAEHVVQLSAPHLLDRSEAHFPHVVSRRPGLFHQRPQFWRDCRREGQHDEAPALSRRFVSS